MAWYNPTYSYAPSSSPDSSPQTGPEDSSPYPSPSIEPLVLDDEEPSIIHPFAGSYLSQRQKRVNISPGEGDDSRVSKKARHVSQDSQGSAEELLWSEESTRAYEDGGRMFDLSNKHLTRIDVQFIRDLKKMVVFPHQSPGLSREAELGTKLRHFDPQAPAVAARQVRRAFSRNESKNSALLPGEKDENIHLYLVHNEITKLPRELWTLENLTTLSLRGNKITYLPPEIGNLKKLRDLNVSTNQLKFLPCELNNLSLVHLNVHPNLAFFAPPSENKRPASDPECMMVSPLPSLVELAFRVLGSPPTADMQSKFDTRSPPRNVLEYYLPLSIDFLKVVSLPLRQILDAYSPECIPKDMLDAQEGEDEPPGIGRCANPGHTARFVRHAEQRYTWEKRVAGIIVGGAVPLRWRGCLRGCLSFLDEVEDGDSDLEDCAIFEPVTLNDGPLDFDDADD